MQFRRYGDAFDNKLRGVHEADTDRAFAAHIARLQEPTKRELREQIAEAVRNTAKLSVRGE